MKFICEEKRNIILNLNVINSININEKLIIKNNLVYIDKPTIFRFLRRIINKNNREQTYLFILNLIECCILEMNRYILFKNNKSTFNLNDLEIKNDRQYSQIFWKFIDLKHAVKKLKETYKSDFNFTKKLDLILLKIKFDCDNLIIL